jgi:hypothetical protein
MKITLNELRSLVREVLSEEDKKKKNTKEVIITVPNEAILKKAKSTPTFSRLSRKDLKVGKNEETVNHKQFADMERLYPLIGIKVEEVKDYKK